MKSLSEKGTDLLNSISLGKYDRGLYHHGKRFQSSIAGGICTLIIIVTIITYATFVFHAIVGPHKEFRLDQSVKDLKYSGLETVTVSEFFQKTLIINHYQLIALKMAIKTVPICS